MILGCRLGAAKAVKHFWALSSTTPASLFCTARLALMWAEGSLYNSNLRVSCSLSSCIRSLTNLFPNSSRDVGLEIYLTLKSMSLAFTSLTASNQEVREISMVQHLLWRKWGGKGTSVLSRGLDGGQRRMYCQDFYSRRDVIISRTVWVLPLRHFSKDWAEDQHETKSIM